MLFLYAEPGERRAETRSRRSSTAGKGAETRAAILDRAVDLASAEGLEGLTIGRLAAELEMSKSGLFAHFGSKQELQLATVEAAADRFRAAVIEPAAGCSRRAPRACGRWPTAYLAHLDGGAYSGGCFWAATSAEYDDRPGPVRDAIAGALDAWLGELERQAGGRRRRRTRPARLRALRRRDGRQLALPAHRRPAGLRVRPRDRSTACSRSCRMSRAEPDTGPRGRPPTSSAASPSTGRRRQPEAPRHGAGASACASSRR